MSCLLWRLSDLLPTLLPCSYRPTRLPTMKMDFPSLSVAAPTSSISIASRYSPSICTYFCPFLAMSLVFDHSKMRDDICMCGCMCGEVDQYI